MSKQIFLVFACDEWKSRDSMRLEMATTSVQRLKSFISEKIKDGVYGYGNSDANLGLQAAWFRADFGSVGFNKEASNYINGRLICGYFECVDDGEEL